MANAKCPCGNHLSNSSSPCDQNGWLLTDRQVMDECDEVDGSAIITIARDVWECPECGRIGIGTEGLQTLIWFAPDDNKYHGVCK